MRVALALGSGGARGYAHIGAIRELHDRGHRVVHLSGSSMGAVVGGMTAAGRLDEFETWVRGLSQRDVLRMLDVTFTGGGAIRGDRIMEALGGLLGRVRIEELPIPFTAVATDLRARREVWFTRGPLDLALRASFAIPSVISPTVVAGRLLVDGGVTNPVPMEPLASAEADMVMAVALNGRRAGALGSTVVESSDPAERRQRPDPDGRAPGGPDRAGGHNRLIQAGAQRARTAIGGRLRSAAEDVRDLELLRAIAERLGQGRLDDMDLGAAPGGAAPGPGGVAGGSDEELGSLPPTLGMFEVVAQSIDAMEAILTAHRMAGTPPDVLVDVPADTCSTFDFHRASEVVEVGRALAAEALDRAGC